LDLRPASPSLAALGLRPCCSLQHQRTQGSFFDVLSSEEQLPSATALDRRNLSRTIALLRHSSNYGPRHKVGHLCSRYTGMRRRNGLYSHATINRVLFVRGVDISAIKQFEEAMLVRERHSLSPTTTLCVWSPQLWQKVGWQRDAVESGEGHSRRDRPHVPTICFDD
jgi:hypothetical protein